MSRITARLALAAGAALVVSTLVGVAPATATGSCVAQSGHDERQAYGPAWGRTFPGYLASHREVLQEFGFSSFGSLASYAAAQDPDDCPPDL